MKWIPLILVLLSCTKEPQRKDVHLYATCRQCAIEFTDNQGLHRDTILWNLTNHGEDTLPNTGIWNIAFLDGNVKFNFKACPLRTDTFTEVYIKAYGDIPMVEASADGECATISQ